MTTLFDCALNGVLLSSLSQRISVLDIQESTPKVHQTALTLFPEGRQQLQVRRDSITVKVLFAIHEEKPYLRTRVLERIRQWAAPGGVLTCTDHVDRQLTVICTGMPTITADNWTEPCTVTFQTTRCPYWEDVILSSINGDGALSIYVPGTAEYTLVNALIQNDSGEDITRITLRAGSTQMTFENILFPAGYLMLLNETDGPLKVEILGESILHCRTADSDDLLLLPCGKESTVYATADKSVSAGFTARGRYL